MIIKTMNLIGTALFAFALISIIGDWNFSADIILAILGIVLTIPDTVRFQRRLYREESRLYGYWMVKLTGYVFVLAVLVIIFIMQIKNNDFFPK